MKHYHTFARDFGPVVPANAIGDLAPAISERRVITVMKKRGIKSRAPGMATVCYDESKPDLTLCHLVTARPIPPSVVAVDGMCKNADALAVIEWALRLKG